MEKMVETKEENKKQRFLEMLESIETPDRYSMRFSEFITLIHNYSEFEAIRLAFNYGFKRGTNYGRKGKNEKRRIKR